MNRWETRRSGAGAGAMRYERSARSRSSRAHSHLERVRARRSSGEERSFRPPAWAVVAASAALGTLVGGASLSAAPIRAIYVRGAEHLSPEAIARASGVARGAAGASVDRAAVAERLAGEPWIAAARVVTLPNGRLLVSVTERVAVATAQVGDAEPLFVDASGTLFAGIGADAPVLPRLVPAAPVSVGEPEPSLADAVALAGEFEAHGLARPEEIALTDESDPTGYVVRLPGLGAHILLGREDVASRLDELKALLAGDVAELATAAQIDLRFADQAVLRGEPLPEGVAKAAATRGGA